MAGNLVLPEGEEPQGYSDAAPQPSGAATAEAVRRATDIAWGPTDSKREFGLKLIYWKRCNNQQCYVHDRKGWVVLGPSMKGDPGRYQRFIEENHMTPLPRYGEMDTGTAEPANYPPLRFDKLLMGEGLGEMPAAQVIAYGWDKMPVIRQAHPELRQQEEIVRITCQYGCIDRDFVEHGAYMKHVRAIHSEAIGPESIGKTLQEGLTTAIAGISNAQAGIGPTEISQIVAATVIALEQHRTSGLEEAEAAKAVNETAAGDALAQAEAARKGMPNKRPVVEPDTLPTTQ
jgi:hypothetical protein